LFVVKRNKSVGGTDKRFLFVSGEQIPARNVARTSKACPWHRLFVVKRNENQGGTDKPFLFVRGTEDWV
jgi:hypothetical protein